MTGTATVNNDCTTHMNRMFYALTGYSLQLIFAEPGRSGSFKCGLSESRGGAYMPEQAENIDILVMMRSGREHRIAVTPAEMQELIEHPDIGSGRVFVLGVTTQYTGIPRNRLFPGIKLTRVKEGKTRVRIGKPVQPVGPLGYIEWYSGPLMQGIFNSRREQLLQE